MVDYLTLNTYRFSYDQIVKGDFYRDELSPFEMGTLAFCKDWLKGKMSFELTTSGSTGSPKTIQIGRNQMQASAVMTLKKLGLLSNDRMLVCMDTAYIAGKMMLVRGFEGNMAMTIVTPTSDPFKLLPADFECDFTALVPFQIKTILEGRAENKAILNRMKAIIIGGGAVSFALEKELQSIKAPVYSTYAMTETVSHIALKKLNGADKESLYHTLPGVKIGVDERGCLTINAPVTNDQTIVTNDLVTIIDEESFKWEGRIDNVINSGGIKIQVERLEAEIEKILKALHISQRFIVAGIPSASLGEQVVLVLEGNALDKAMEQMVNYHFKRSLSTYHVPKSIHYLPRFIETETGKIQRKKSLKGKF